jgi:hypothetical protein
MYLLFLAWAIAAKIGVRFDDPSQSLDLSRGRRYQTGRSRSRINRDQDKDNALTERIGRPAVPPGSPSSDVLNS